MAKAKARTAEEAAQDVAVDDQAVETIVIEIPISRESGAVSVRHLDVQLVGHHGGAVQRRALQALRGGLNISDTRLANGTHVGGNSSHAIRWILEQIAQQIE